MPIKNPLHFSSLCKKVEMAVSKPYTHPYNIVQYSALRRVHCTFLIIENY